jgi:hypothetical protein
MPRRITKLPTVAQAAEAAKAAIKARTKNPYLRGSTRKLTALSRTASFPQGQGSLGGRNEVQGFSVSRPQVLRGQNFLRLTQSDGAIPQKQGAVEVIGDKVQLVDGNEDREALLGKVPQKAQDLLLRGRVQSGQRFVQKEDSRLLGQSPGDEHSLPFAAGKLANSAAGKMGKAHTGKGLLGL